MKAIVYHKYGSPDVLELQELDKPVVKDNQVLVRVHAASANPLDWHRMRGEPFLVRLEEGFLKPKNPKLGADIAGQVEAVGSHVTEFQPGNEVFGYARVVLPSMRGWWCRRTSRCPRPTRRRAVRCPTPEALGDAQWEIYSRESQRPHGFVHEAVVDQ